LRATDPHIGFLLENGKKRILVDTGISERYIVNGRSWGGYAAKGGSQFVISALAKEGLRPDDIDVVLYTHLHHTIIMPGMRVLIN
jgi:glyoxylase-like metal-dependent hydrolase (beta-lactamase superfamily II)